MMRAIGLPKDHIARACEVTAMLLQGRRIAIRTPSHGSENPKSVSNH
jgi:hypothetical protein